MEIVMHPMESSFVASVGHDAERKILKVILNGDKEYLYSGVDLDTFTNMLAAPSVGRFYNTQIQGKFEKIEEGEKLEMVNEFGPETTEEGHGHGQQEASEASPAVAQAPETNEPADGLQAPPTDGQQEAGATTQEGPEANQGAETVQPVDDVPPASVPGEDSGEGQDDPPQQ